MKILVLSAEWVILIISTLPDVVKEIDRLSGGKFAPDIKKWVDSKDFNARKRWRELRDKHIAQARINVGEQALDLPESYSPLPAQVGRVLVGIDESETIGGPETEYVHYCYLRLAKPMEPGQTYTFEARGQKASIAYGTETISRAIKVNQVGYLPDASGKFAYVGAHIYGVGPMTIDAMTFDVRRASDGAVVFSGPIRIRDANSRILDKTGKLQEEITGEIVYDLDFTGLTEIGEFYIQVPGVGRSWAFRHAPDAYGEAFYTATRGLFHHRCHAPLKEPYTRWTRPQCHTAPAGECDMIGIPPMGEIGQSVKIDAFDVVGATTDMSRPINSTGGGWHDAADWDKRSSHYTPVFDLLYAYEMAPEKFTDGQLNIPGSGNGIPDILDEAAWGLQVWLKSMLPNGGVSGCLETCTHPAVDSKVNYAYARRTRWDSLAFAAAAAMLSQHTKPFSPKESEKWRWYAKKTYDFGANPKNSLGKTEIRARKDRGTGDAYTIPFEEKEAYVEPFLIHAAVRMYLLTKDTAYLKGIKDMLPRQKAPVNYPYSIKDYSPWMFYNIAKGDDPNLAALRPANFVKDKYLREIDKFLSPITDAPYRCSFPKHQNFYMAWGLTVTTNYGRSLLIAHALTGDRKYRDAAILNCDFMFGANAMGMSWTTGLGQVYPIHFQSGASQTDGIPDPIPGITLYGHTGGSYQCLRDTVWRSPGPKGPMEFKVTDIPLWRRWSCHPTANTAQCEYTIHETLSSTIVCAALLLSPGWSPSAELKKRKHRPVDKLHGLWYLP